MTETFIFKMTVEQKRLLEKKAKAKGLSSGAYLRMLIITS